MLASAVVFKVWYSSTTSATTSSNEGKFQNNGTSRYYAPGDPRVSSRVKQRDRRKIVAAKEQEDESSAKKFVKNFIFDDSHTVKRTLSVLRSTGTLPPWADDLLQTEYSADDSETINSRRYRDSNILSEDGIINARSKAIGRRHLKMSSERARLIGGTRKVFDECAAFGLDDGVYCCDNIHDGPSVSESMSTPSERIQTSFQRLGTIAFTHVIDKYRGDVSNVRENAKIDDLVNPTTNRTYEFDAYYADEVHRIAVEFQAAHHSVYPNVYHRTRSDFDIQRNRDAVKAAAAAREGILFIQVPHTVDNSRSSEDARIVLIETFVELQIANYYYELSREAGKHSDCLVDRASMCEPLA